MQSQIHRIAKLIFLPSLSFSVSQIPFSIQLLQFIVKSHKKRSCILFCTYIHTSTVSLGTSVICTHASWTNISILSSVGSWWNHQDCWTHQRQNSFRLDKFYPQGVPDPLSHIPCLDCKSCWGARGTNFRQADTEDLSDLFIGIMALVSARVSFDLSELWQRIDQFFQLIFCSGHCNVPGNGGIVFLTLTKNNLMRDQKPHSNKQWQHLKWNSF